jgi:hypothetical protein
MTMTKKQAEALKRKSIAELKEQFESFGLSFSELMDAIDAATSIRVAVEVAKGCDDRAVELPCTQAMKQRLKDFYKGIDHSEGFGEYAATFAKAYGHLVLGRYETRKRPK